MKRPIKNMIHLIGYSIKRFNREGHNYRAAALTYTSLLSMVPLLAVIFGILSVFPIFKSISNQLKEFIFTNFASGTGQVVQSYMEKFIEQTTRLSIVGSFFLVITAIMMLFTMEKAFNAIWRVRAQRSKLRAFLLYWCLLTFSPILMGVGLAISSYLTSLPFITHTAESLGITKFILAMMPFFLNMITFTLLYVVLPNCKVPFRSGLYAGIIAALLFEIAKKGFALYIMRFSSYQLLYGSLAAIPIFLIWIYLSWLIILFGALISNIYALHWGRRTGEKLDSFVHAYRWLNYFWRAQQSGASLSLQELNSLDHNDYIVEPETQLNYLLQTNLIKEDYAGNFVLNRDLSTLTVFNLYEYLPWKLPSLQQLPQEKQPCDKALADLLKMADKNLQEQLNIPLVKLFNTI